jgi:hypothetical protein
MLMLSPAPTRHLNQITRHIGRTIGHSPMVFHEMLEGVRLDLHVVPPLAGPASAAHPYGRSHFTLVTSGLSAAGGQMGRCAELMISLPADWPGLRADGTFAPEMMQEDVLSWPVRLLKSVAHICREQGPKVGELFPVMEGGQKLRNVPFAAAAVLPSMLHPQSTRLVVHDDLAISFLALFPLYEEELRAGISGTQLAATLAQRNVTDLVDVRRGRLC